MSQFDPDIEEELDSFDFDEEDVLITREGLGKRLMQQKYCTHEFESVYKGDVKTGVRCKKCLYQVWL